MENGGRNKSVNLPPIIVREPGRNCTRLIASLLAILLGCFGVHKFYMGYTKEGIITIIAGTAGALLVLPFVAAVGLGLAEGVIYLTLTDDEWRRKYLTGQQGWL